MIVSDRGRIAIELIIVASIAIGVYSSVYDAPFVYDDINHIVRNEGIRDISDLRGVLFCGTQETRPLYNLSLAVNYAVGGYDPRGYHLVNILFHILAAIALYFVVLNLCWFASETHLALPVVVACLFVAHPIATESVTYVNSRSGVMATTFYLWSFAFYLGYRRLGSRPRYLAAIAAFILSLVSKEMTVTLPLVLLATELLVAPSLTRGAVARRILAILPFLLLLSVVAVLFVVFRSPHKLNVGFSVMDPWIHLATQFRVIMVFMGLLIVPLGLNLDHDLPLSPGLLHGPTLLALLALLAIVAAGMLIRKRARLLFFGLVFFLLTIAPTNSVIPFYDYIAERHCYLPAVGYALALGWLITVVCRRALAAGHVGRLTGALLLLAPMGLLGWLTMERNDVWRSEQALWEDTVRKSPGKARPAANLGVVYAEKKRYSEAVELFLIAKRADPETPGHWHNLGALYRQLGELDAEIALYREHMVVTSSSRTARVMLSGSLYRRGVSRLRRGMVGAAVRDLYEVVQLRPENPRGHLALAEGLMLTGKLEAAHRSLEESLRLDPKDRQALELLLRLQRAQLDRQTRGAGPELRMRRRRRANRPKQ